MGKYSLELLRALHELKIHKDYTIKLLFNSKHSLDKDRETVLNEIFPNSEHVYMDFAVSKNLNDWRSVFSQNTKLINKYISHNHSKDYVYYLILSLFEGEWVSCFPDNVQKKLVIFYDLIPYLFHEHYLKDKAPRNFYLQKFKVLCDADIVYTISQTTCDDIATNLGFPDHKLVNIDGARITRLGLKPTRPDSIGTISKYILMPSGDDFRKNNERAVEAFSAFNNESGHNHTLVITSTFTEQTRERLKVIEPNIVFSGNVSEGELLWLYKNSELILFAPEYEGLGLPILEAVDVNKRIVCSDIPVFREMSSSAFTYFNPHDVNEIKKALHLATSTKDMTATLPEYKQIEEKYNWHNTAKRFLSTLEDTRSADSKEKSSIRIAIVGPDPTGYSGIGRVLESLHLRLSENAKVEYFLESSQIDNARPSFLPFIANCHDAMDFSEVVYNRFDYVIYHIGNSENHVVTAKHALRLPGVAIVHDTNLSGLFDSMLSMGVIDKIRYDLELKLNKKLCLKNSPFTATIVNSQRAVIVHSKYASSNLRKSIINNKTERVVHTNLPIVEIPLNPKVSKKGFLKIGLAGVISESKGISLIERVADNELFRSCEFNVFGYDYPMSHEFYGRHSQGSKIRYHTNLTDYRYGEMINYLDVLIAFRKSYNGESSHTTLEAMRAGLPVIVRDIGWFSELPDDVVYKVTSEDEVLFALKDLLVNPKLRSEIGRAAYEYVAREHTPDSYVSKVIEVCKKNLKSLSK